MKRLLFALLLIPTLAAAAFEWNGASVTVWNGASITDWNGAALTVPCGNTAILGTVPPINTSSSATALNWKGIEYVAASSNNVCRVHFLPDTAQTGTYSIGVAIWLSDGNVPPKPTGNALAQGLANIDVSTETTVDLDSPVALTSGTAYIIGICVEDLATDLTIEYKSSAGTKNYVSHASADRTTPPAGDASWNAVAQRELGISASY